MRPKPNFAVALSSSEAEYCALSQGVSEGPWATRLVAEFGENIERFQLMCDNQSVISMIKNRPARQAKHIDIRCCFIIDAQLKGMLDVKYVRADEQKADFLTKPMKPNMARRALAEIVGSNGECCE